MGRNAGNTLWVYTGRGRKRANIAEFMEFREGRIVGERDYRLLPGMVSESRWERRGSTRVLFWDRKLWYRSAIVLGERNGQYPGCVGKVRASQFRYFVCALQHPADTLR